MEFSTILQSQACVHLREQSIKKSGMQGELKETRRTEDYYLYHRGHMVCISGMTIEGKKLCTYFTNLKVKRESNHGWFFCISRPACRNIPGFLLFPDFGVLNSSISDWTGEGEFIFISSEGQSFSSLSFNSNWASSMNSFLHSMLGCAVTPFELK